jgi:hypothetical protein
MIVVPLLKLQECMRRAFVLAADKKKKKEKKEKRKVSSKIHTLLYCYYWQLGINTITKYCRPYS